MQQRKEGIDELLILQSEDITDLVFCFLKVMEVSIGQTC
jgi:hypothetical protein